MVVHVINGGGKGWGDYIGEAFSQLMSGYVNNMFQKEQQQRQFDYDSERARRQWGREDSKKADYRGMVDSSPFVAGDPYAAAGLLSKIAGEGVDVQHIADFLVKGGAYAQKSPVQFSTGGKTFMGAFNPVTGNRDLTEYINTPDPTNVYVADRNLEGTKYTADSNKAGVLGSAGIAANSANARSARELAQRERLWNIERGDLIPSTGVVGDDGELRYVNKEGKMVRTGIFPKTPPQPQGANVDPKTALGLLKITRDYDGNVLPGMENLDSLVNQYAMDILKPTQPQQQPQQQMGPPTVNIPGFTDGGGQGGLHGVSALTAPEVLSGLVDIGTYRKALEMGYSPAQITAMVNKAKTQKKK